MDIFNKKKVESLERELAKIQRERDDYRYKTMCLEEKFAAMSKLEESIPEDCVRGPWCKACEFVRTFHYVEHHGYGVRSETIAYACSKGECCNHFVKREVEQNE